MKKSFLSTFIFLLLFGGTNSSVRGDQTPSPSESCRLFFSRLDHFNEFPVTASELQSLNESEWLARQFEEGDFPFLGQFSNLDDVSRTQYFYENGFVFSIQGSGVVDVPHQPISGTRLVDMPRKIFSRGLAVDHSKDKPTSPNEYRGIDVVTGASFDKWYDAVENLLEIGKAGLIENFIHSRVKSDLELQQNILARYEHLVNGLKNLRGYNLRMISSPKVQYIENTKESFVYFQKPFVDNIGYSRNSRYADHGKLQMVLQKLLPYGHGMAVFQYFVFSKGGTWWAELGHFYFTVRVNPLDLKLISAAQITEKQGIDFIAKLLPHVPRYEIVLKRDMGHLHIVSLGRTKESTTSNLKVLDGLILDFSRYLMFK